MWPSVLYNLYAKSSHEKTGHIITFAQFEEGGLVENERNVSEDESILAFIDKLSTYHESDDWYMSRNALKGIWDEKYVHLDILSRYYIFSIHDRIRPTKTE